MYPIYELGLRSWKNYFFLTVLAKLTSYIIDYADLLREGDKSADEAKIKSTVDMYVNIMLDNWDKAKDNGNSSGKGTDEDDDDCENESKPIDNTSPGYALYNEIFVTEYTRRMEKYYRELSNELKTTPLRLAEFAIDSVKRETKISGLFLREPFATNILNKVRKLVADTYTNVYVAGFKASLDVGSKEDTRTFFLAVSSSVKKDPGVDLLVEKFKEAVVTQGKTVMASIAPMVEDNPNVFPETVIDLWREGKKLIKNSLDGVAKFTSAMGTGFTTFINNSSLFGKHNDSSKAAELMAKYLDTILKKRSAKSSDSASTAGSGPKANPKDEARDLANTFVNMHNK